MKQSAASTIPQYHLPPFLAAVGHNTVCTPNNKGGLPVDPSVARSTLRSSPRHWAQLFFWSAWSRILSNSFRSNITGRVSGSLFVYCTASAKRRCRVQMLVSKVSHCAFLRALAYDMKLSVRCRRWKPMIRRRNWGGVRFGAQRSALGRESTSHTCTAGSPSPLPLACAPSGLTEQSPYRKAPA